MENRLKIIFALTLTLWGSLSLAAICPAPWVCENLKLKIPFKIFVPSPAGLLSVVTELPETIRAGFLPEVGSFKGNIIYYQGLGDSMLNHRELFGKLSRAGYRVLAFDYMGQGGSTGSMNNTQLEYIPWIANKVWKRFADTARNPDKNILGWSTGGLAAYMEAAKGLVKKVILIAPGNTANLIVGEGFSHWPVNEITLRTLTTDIYGQGNPDPHVDPIRPNSPAVIFLFAANLLTTSALSRITKIPAKVEGLVLLSGANDSYVNGADANKVFAQTAPHFERQTYAGALHEIDNEKKSIREKAHKDILNFLESAHP